MKEKSSPIIDEIASIKSRMNYHSGSKHISPKAYRDIGTGLDYMERLLRQNERALKFVENAHKVEVNKLQNEINRLEKELKNFSEPDPEKEIIFPHFGQGRP